MKIKKIYKGSNDITSEVLRIYHDSETIYESVQEDTSFLYIGETTFYEPTYFHRLSIKDLEILDTVVYDPNSNYGIDFFIQIDENHLYVGQSQLKEIRKYNKDDLTYVSNILHTINLYELRVKDDYLYAAFSDSSNNVIRKYNKLTLQYVSQSSCSSKFTSAMFADEDYIYIDIGSPSRFFVRYSMAYGNFKQSAAYGSSGADTCRLVFDDDYIYCGTAMGKIMKYSKSDLSIVFTGSQTYNGVIRGMAIDEDYLYIIGSDTDTRVKKYNKSDLTLHSSSGEFGIRLIRIILKDDYLYIASNRTLQKLDKYDLSVKASSVVFDLPIVGMTID